MQHRRLDFEELVLEHEAANGRDDLATVDEGLARFFRHDQVDIALAILDLLIGQAVEFFG
jgi:hypothetical protein